MQYCNLPSATVAVATLAAVSVLITPAFAKDKAEGNTQSKRPSHQPPPRHHSWALYPNKLPRRSQATMTPNRERHGKTIGGTVKAHPGRNLYRGGLRRKPNAGARTGHQTPTRS